MLSYNLFCVVVELADNSDRSILPSVPFVRQVHRKSLLLVLLPFYNLILLLPSKLSLSFFLRWTRERRTRSYSGCLQLLHYFLSSSRPSLCTSPMPKRMVFKLYVATDLHLQMVSIYTALYVFVIKFSSSFRSDISKKVSIHHLWIKYILLVTICSKVSE